MFMELKSNMNYPSGWLIAQGWHPVMGFIFWEHMEQEHIFPLAQEKSANIVSHSSVAGRGQHISHRHSLE